MENARLNGVHHSKVKRSTRTAANAAGETPRVTTLLLDSSATQAEGSDDGLGDLDKMEIAYIPIHEIAMLRDESRILQMALESKLGDVVRDGLGLNRGATGAGGVEAAIAAKQWDVVSQCARQLLDSAAVIRLAWSATERFVRRLDKIEKQCLDTVNHLDDEWPGESASGAERDASERSAQIQ
ncbi:MAG TPA: hypothetical protein VK550_11185 [Polyangiaceae bacterium]|nr:hypothetical protein [Polyangiaceae bacterium]